MRGINVGGNNILPMKTLRALLEDIGAVQVSTYIQSGNAVFQHAESDAPDLASQIRSTVASHCGFDAHVLLIDVEDFDLAMRNNPFLKEADDPKSVHLWFLSGCPVDPDLEGINAIKTESEAVLLKDRVFYLFAPDGIGRSKVAAKAERLLGVEATARNWRTACRVREMAGALEL